MLEVIVLCEGHAEREFCRSVLAPHVAARGVALSGTLVGKPQSKRGGIGKWSSYRDELLRLASQRAGRHLAVLVDYYAMPHSWPERARAGTLPREHRGSHVETALRNDLRSELGTAFHPCVQLHEFESLLFVDPELSALSVAIGGGLANHHQLAQDMTKIKLDCGGSAEFINDSPQLAPSKRLTKLIPGYDKVGWGVTAAADVEVPVLRAGCPWLDRWLKSLEALGGSHG
jgi:hypothetical protein